jgi:glycosyltransferase involved in cell wall biosynthesis
MKVLFLTHSYPRFDGDTPGGFILRLGQALQRDGVDIRVVAPASPGHPSEEVLGGIPVTRFRYAPRKYETLAYTGNMAHDVASQWSARFAMVGLLGAYFTSAVRMRRQFKPDLIHAHWWFPGGLVGTWVSKLAQIPLMTTLHGSDARLMRGSSAMRPLARMVLHHSTYVTTVSNWLAGTVKDVATHANVAVAQMPVETDLFTPDHTREPDRILLVGRMNAQKGVSYAIRALAVMQSVAYLDIVGDGPALEEYRTLARELSVSDRVIFHGHVAHEALPAMYRRATVLVVPSTEEGLGLVAVEAQLCETPVVAFDSGGIPDVVQHDKTGLLVPPADVPALAAALDRVLSYPAHADALGRAGRMAALARFSPEATAERYKGLYRQALSDPRAA